MDISLQDWKDGVKSHMTVVDQIVEDRILLKSSIEEYLSKVFEWDEIEYNRDFTVISMYWTMMDEKCPVINGKDLSEFEMDWLIRLDNANRIVIIEVYPFGVEGVREE